MSHKYKSILNVFLISSEFSSDFPINTGVVLSLKTLHFKAIAVQKNFLRKSFLFWKLLIDDLEA